MRHGLMLRKLHAPADAVDVALAAAEAGFETLYLGERHFDAADGFANAFAVAAAISGRLQRARIGVAPALGMEHPLRLVEQANMLDILTDGRSLVVVSDRLEPRQYAAFGLPVPRNGLLEDFLHHLEQAWSWEYREDGRPLEFHSGPYMAKMAGRIMPTRRPRVALETDSNPGVRDAARRGWLIQLRVTSLAHARQLMDSYREALASAGHSARVVDDCLDGVTVVVGESSSVSVSELRTSGVAEARFDIPLEDAIRMVR
jgi:alkanesulfonate monooxygenase SsuD/methylene tetrahydromethanopterin reductase-like flavin-dependent oxidoreductase (luciferase family)